MAKLSPGKQFEKDLQDSCSSKDNIFFYRIKDQRTFNPKCINCPHNMSKFTVKNECDCFVYKKPLLLPIELKSTKGKSIAINDRIIKPQQIKKLNLWRNIPGVAPGFIFNFREPVNQTFWVHIKPFMQYLNVLKGKLESPFKAKVNKSSIPIRICEEIGVEIKSEIKRVHYRYFMDKFIERLISEFKNNKVAGRW